MNWGYISALWSTLLLNCIQPVNMKACLQVQDWLFPAVHDYIRYKEGIYVNEKRVLKQFRLDGGSTKLE